MCERWIVLRNDTHKIVFNDGGNTKVIRGTIVKEDDFFIYLQRDNGIGRIGKQTIIKIVPINNHQGDDP